MSLIQIPIKLERYDVAMKIVRDEYENEDDVASDWRDRGCPAENLDKCYETASLIAALELLMENFEFALDVQGRMREEGIISLRKRLHELVGDHFLEQSL